MQNAKIMLEKWVNHPFNAKHAFLLSIVLALCSIINQHGGVAHPEIYTYLPYYLSDKPLLSKLYDSKSLDMNLYQSRELSYFFDYLDCKFIELSVKLGHPHFLSIVIYTFLLITSMTIWWFCTHQVRLPPILGLALLALYWTSPSIFLVHSYFRSSKVGVTLICAILFLLTHRYLARETSPADSRITLRQWAGIVILSLAMTLFDRQGVYFIAMTMVFIVLWSIFFSHRNNIILLVAFFASLVLSSLYNYLIGPFLTQYWNHYQPNFSYQHLRWEKLFNYLIEYLWAGTSLYLDTLRFLLGNIPSDILAVALIISILGIFIKIYKDLRTTGKMSKFSVVSLGIIICNVILMICMNSLMVLRHTPMVEPDVRRTYYWMPEVTILSMTIALALGFFLRNTKLSVSVVLLILVIMIVGNIAALPEHDYITTHGHMKASFEYAPTLLEGLRNINNRQYEPPDKVRQDGIYIFFTQRMKQQ